VSDGAASHLSAALGAQPDPDSEATYRDGHQHFFAEREFAL
jgi:hypothetical protein